MEKPTGPKKSKVGRPRRLTELDAMLAVLQALQPLNHEQRSRVIKTADAWLSATHTEGVNLE